MTSFEVNYDLKNLKGVPLVFLNFKILSSKTIGICQNIEGGAVPGNKDRKFQIWLLIRGGLFRGGGCSG